MHGAGSVNNTLPTFFWLTGVSSPILCSQAFFLLIPPSHVLFRPYIISTDRESEIGGFFDQNGHQLRTPSHHWHSLGTNVAGIFEVTLFGLTNCQHGSTQLYA